MDIIWKRQQVINELEYTKNIQKYHIYKMNRNIKT